MSLSRFHHQNRVRQHFTDFPVLVECPRCNKCARVTRRPHKKGHLFIARCVCSTCSFVKEKEIKVMSYWWQGMDMYFDYPLYFRIPFGSHVFWAYNLEHLKYIESLVRAGIRDTTHHGGVASKLPKWIKLAKNRRQLLKKIQILKEKYSSDTP